jgi:photosystem II stability/assembly factor-like uncharacterized protein
MDMSALLTKYPIIYCFIVTVSVMFAADASAQQVEVLNSRPGISFRGLSVVSDRLIWICGSQGTVGRSVDGGNTFEWLKIDGYEKRDFRDIEAFDKYTAVVMAAGEPGLVLKTIDGGKRWKAVYMNHTPGMFFDAMEFWNEQSGILIGDPINGRFFIARTFDGGSNWRRIHYDKLPVADSGEACFAASGTNIRALSRGEACFVSGGIRSRFYWKGKTVDLPLVQGTQTAGANSIAVWPKRKGRALLMVVGGDFNVDTASAGNCARSSDGGKTWSVPEEGPNGYRSCVEFISKDRLVTCGLSGVDVSADGGKRWRKISDTGFHVCRKAKKGTAVFLAGNGRVGRLEWNK